MTDSLPWRNSARKAAAWVMCLVAITAFLLRVVLPSAKTPNTTGFATCYAESRILLERPRDLRFIYDDSWFQPEIDQALGGHVEEIAHGQPPTMSFILAPLAWMSAAKARAAWIGLSTLLWVAGLVALSSGLRLKRVHGIPPLLWLTAVTTLYRPIADNLRRGQGYTLLFCLLSLLVWVILRTETKRWWLGGIALGSMLVLKSGGLWLYPLFAVARQVGVLAGAAAVVALVVLVCSPLMGWDIWRIYLEDAVRWLSTEPSNHVAAYQTVSSLMGHLFIYDATWNPRPVADVPTLAKGLTVLLLGIVFTTSARLQRLSSQRLEERALTMGMFICPLVPAAPIGEGYHYVLLLPAVVIAWWWASRARASMQWQLVLLACSILLVTPQRFYDSSRLQVGWAAVLAYPRLYGALGLWALLARALSDDRSRPVDPTLASA